MGLCSSHVQFFVACQGVTIALVIGDTRGGDSVFMVRAGVGTGVGGVGQSYLVLNRFSEADPVFSQGVPCLTRALGMSSDASKMHTT